MIGISVIRVLLHESITPRGKVKYLMWQSLQEQHKRIVILNTREYFWERGKTKILSSLCIVSIVKLIRRCLSVAAVLSMTSPAAATNAVHFWKNTQCALEGGVALSYLPVQESWGGQSDLFLLVGLALLWHCFLPSLFSALGCLSPTAPCRTKENSPSRFQNLQYVLPTAIEREIVRVIREVTLLSFFKGGL